MSERSNKIKIVAVQKLESIYRDERGCSSSVQNKNKNKTTIKKINKKTLNE